MRVELRTGPHALGSHAADRDAGRPGRQAWTLESAARLIATELLRSDIGLDARPPGGQGDLSRTTWVAVSASTDLDYVLLAYLPLGMTLWAVFPKLPLLNTDQPMPNLSMKGSMSRVGPTGR